MDTKSGWIRRWMLVLTAVFCLTGLSRTALAAEVPADCAHEHTALVHEAAATTKADGYTGDLVCRDCGETLSTGTKIAKIASVTLSKTSCVYSGERKKPGVTVRDSGGKKISSSFYTVKYSDNKKVGKAKAAVTFSGNYSGSVSKSFKILPKGTSIRSLKALSKGFLVKWKAQTAQVTGYQIQYAVNSKFTRGRKTITVKAKKTVQSSVTSVRAKKKYYVRVRTYKTVGDSRYYSSWSRAKSVTTKQRVTVFAGDSIATGLYASEYNGISMMDISGSNRVVAYKGLNTMTYQTTPVFDGEPGLDHVIGLQPYRVYFMLGINEIEWRSVSAIMKNYREIIETIQEEVPATDLVVLAVSPVSRSVASSRTGFKNISRLNAQLKAMAKQYGIRYYDYTASFKDSSGYLKSQYNSGDGIHWNISGYRTFARVISAYDKKIEK